MTVVRFRGITKAGLPVEQVLHGVLEDNLAVVLVLGRNAEGDLLAYGSDGTMETNVLLCEEFKHKLLAGEIGEP